MPSTTDSILRTPAGGPAATSVTLALAHGAGAAMDSDFMRTMADLVARRGVGVVRFEFAYMAMRRLDGKRRPPPKIEKLMGEYRAILERIGVGSRLLIGGKSMGGRVASLIADDLHARGAIAGLVCLGYPFHPSGKPERLRTAHLTDLRCPTLMVQGEADPLGSRAEVAGYALSPAVGVHWVAGADHDLVPKAGGGLTKAQACERAWTDTADAIAAFARAL